MDTKLKLKLLMIMNKQKIFIKKALYFQDKDLNKYSIFYIDNDKDECPLEEALFSEAYSPEIKEWELIPNHKEEDEDNNDAKKNSFSETIESIKDNVQSKIQNVQKEVNEQVNKIKNDLISKFTQIVNEKITAINKKYEEKIKKLEEVNKLIFEKNKDSLEQMEKANESSIKKIIDDLSKLAEEKIEKELDDYNKNFTNTLNLQITSSKIQINEKKNEINDKIEDLAVKQNNMISNMDQAKNSFRNLYSSMKIDEEK